METNSRQELRSFILENIQSIEEVTTRTKATLTGALVGDPVTGYLLGGALQHPTSRQKELHQHYQTAKKLGDTSKANKFKTKLSAHQIKHGNLIGKKITESSQEVKTVDKIRADKTQARRTAIAGGVLAGGALATHKVDQGLRTFLKNQGVKVGPNKLGKVALAAQGVAGAALLARGLKKGHEANKKMEKHISEK